jgi:chromosome segregation ATPase
MTTIQQIEQQQAEIAALKADVAAQTARSDKAEAEATAAKAETVKCDDALKASCAKEQAAVEALAAEKTAHAATKERLEKAERALANPAHMAAAIEGLKTATAEGGVPVSDEPIFKTQAEALAAYNKLPDGMEGARARAEFRAKYKDILGL